MQKALFVAAACIATVQAGVVPTIELEPGVHFPMVGLGTWLYNSTVAEAAVADALALGYTHIDTALVYGNQEGIAKAIKASGRARDSFFVTSKVPGGMSQEDATVQLDLILTQLGLDYVDLVLAHYPADWSRKGGKADRQAGWKALEAFKAAGKTRAIGVSHYCQSHINDILEINTTTIALNQVEYHIGMGSAGVNSNDYRDWDNSQGIQYMGFSSLCGPCGTTELINGPLVTSIGKKYNKSGAQVSLKWVVQQGFPVIPKTDSKTHMTANLDLFDWELSDEDMATLTAQATPAAVGGGKNFPGESGDCEIA